MSNATQNSGGNIQELLAGRVLGDLSDAEASKLDGLMNNKLSNDLRDLEHAAASVQVAFEANMSETLPARLREKLLSDATRSLSGLDPLTTTPARQDGDVVAPAQTDGSRIQSREMFAWLAMAGAVMIAVGLWVSGQSSPSERSASLSRADLIAEATDLVQVSWTDGKTPFGDKVGGDVVWSTSKQQGFMRFVDMPINDPSVEQYQLWIIDPKRGDEPVDGGVFDISESGEVIVPINAKLGVIGPAAFAITIEQPGGVVVSTQDRLPLLAAVE